MDAYSVSKRRTDRLAVHRSPEHVAAVVGLGSLFVGLDATTPQNAGASIGAGLFGLPLDALGLPWTLPTWANPYAFDDVPTRAMYAWSVGAAVFNVVLHYVWLRVRFRTR